MTVKQLRLMNDSMILYLKKIGKSIERNEIVGKILEDDTCFFKMKQDDACLILEDIGIAKDKINLIYSELISKNSYYYLQHIGKIKDDDNEIIIKYETNDLFNNNKETDNSNQIIKNDISTDIYKENFFKRFIKKIKSFFNK